MNSTDADKYGSVPFWFSSAKTLIGKTKGDMNKSVANVTINIFSIFFILNIPSFIII